MPLAGSSGARLPREAFRAKVVDRSAAWSSIVSTDRSVPWFSPSATNMSTPVADLTLLRDASAAGDLTKARSAWLGCLMDIKHKFIVSLTRPGSSREEFFIVGQHMPESCVLAWPVKRERVPKGYDAFYFTLLPTRMPTLLSIWSLERDFVVAWPYEWRPWHWQYFEFPLARNKLKPQVRLFQSGKPSSVLELVARHTWWGLGKAVLTEVATRYQVDIGQGANLYETVFALTKHFTGEDDSEVCEITHARLVHCDAVTEFDDELLAVDAAVEVMGQYDHQAVHEDQRVAASRKAEREAFASAYKVRRIATAPKKRARKAGAPSAPLRLPPISTTPHAGAKRLCPPSASIWRGLTRGEWWGHQKPYQRCSASWQRHGGQGALVVVLQLLWRQALEKQGKDISDCLVEGLFSPST